MSITSGKTLFTADWDDAAFVHYEMEPRDLQPHVPFDLDLYQGRAYLSLVAFVQRGLRPRVGGRLAGLLAAPLASHPFLNVRTYVQHRGERGIYFLREWIPNRLAALIGPPLYGLPYKIGRLTYACDRERGASEHRICAGSGLEFDVAWDADAELRHVEPGSRDEFLLERYTAFTCCRGRPMCFRVDHGPWPQTCARVRMKQIALLTEIGLCLPAGGPVAANVSPGVKRVGLSAPIRVRTEDCKEGRRRPSELVSWLPLIVLVTGVLVFGVGLRPWVWMWCIAGAIFAGCKWLTWWREPMRLQARAGQSAAYLFAWVGMNPREFLAKNPAVAIPRPREWLGAVLRIVVGSALVWTICPRIPAARPMLLGWLGMFGMVLILHFGAFDLLALFWHSRGVNAVPLMRNPLGATSLADFWGRRWNTAFHRLTEQLVFKPLARLANARVAMMSGFVLSGLIHDLVISVPARGGFGLPTLYFVLQGAGVLVERSAAGRRAGLGTGVRGRAFAMLVAAGPAGLLFHPPFVMRVIVPFLRAIGATSHAR